MLFGWDGASYQGRPDQALLKREGHAFVIEKITGEGNYVNPYWQQVREDAHTNGIVFGGYDWVEPQLMAGVADGIAAARDYLRVFNPQPGEIVAVDFETVDWSRGPLGRTIERPMRAYLETLRDAVGGTVLVYTAPYFLVETGAIAWSWMCEANGFYLWQAAPGAGMMADDSFWPATPLPFHRTTMHQHQWHARSAAIPGTEFDRNRFDGTVEELLALAVPQPKVVAEVVTDKKTEASEVREPVAGKWTAYINDAGETVVALNFGGNTARIDGVRIVDIGVSVESATERGVLLDRSFRDEQAQGWRERRAG